jgi:hypothetical protein
VIEFAPTMVLKRLRELSQVLEQLGDVPVEETMRSELIELLDGVVPRLNWVRSRLEREAVASEFRREQLQDVSATREGAAPSARTRTHDAPPTTPPH